MQKEVCAFGTRHVLLRSQKSSGSYLGSAFGSKDWHCPGCSPGSWYRPLMASLWSFPGSALGSTHGVLRCGPSLAPLQGPLLMSQLIFLMLRRITLRLVASRRVSSRHVASRRAPRSSSRSVARDPPPPVTAPLNRVVSKVTTYLLNNPPVLHTVLFAQPLHSIRQRFPARFLVTE